MLKSKKRKAFVYGSVDQGGQTGPFFMIALPVDSPGEVIDISDWNPSKILSDFEIVSDPVQANMSLKVARAKIFEVAQVKFFSQASGVKVVEIAEFDEFLTGPSHIRYVIQLDGDEISLATRPSLELATGYAINEEDRLLQDVRAKRTTTPSLKAGKPKP